MESRPKTARVLALKQFKTKDFDFIERPLPELQPGEALLKVLAAPINPLDIIKLNGGLGGALPYVLGSECVGVVVDTNGPNKDKLIGKKVSATSPTGCWADYIIVKTNFLIVHEDDVDQNQAACGAVNPLTSYGLFSLATKTYKSKGLAVTAGNSAVSKMLVSICAKENVPLISIVRSKAKLSELVALGQKEERVLVSEDEDFAERYAQLAEKLEAKVVIDFVAGPLAGKLVKALPAGGKYINVGSLSGQPIGGVDPTGLRWGGKSLEGFVAFSYFAALNEADQKEHVEFIQKNFKDLFQTTITATVPLNGEKVAEAFDKYSKNMSEGKYIITV